MIYELREREDQRTKENRVYDVFFNGMVIGWLDEHEKYAPHIRIMDRLHVLDKKAMIDTLQSQLNIDGNFFLLSDLITRADVETVTIDDLKAHAERLQAEIEATQREADSFLSAHDEKIQAIKELQKQTDEIIRQIQSQSSENNSITEGTQQ